MQKFTIKSRILGCAVNFELDAEGFIFTDLNAADGSQTSGYGQRLGYNGGLGGILIVFAGQTQSDFEKVCRDWYKKRIQRLK